MFDLLQSRAVCPPKADRSPTSSLGLGLYIAMRVQAHGGMLRVASNVGHAITFTATLPSGQPGA